MNLYKIWENINHIPSWLRILGLGKDFSEKDLTELEMIDKRAISVEKEIQEIYHSTEISRVRKEIDEFKKEILNQLGTSFRKERRLEYLNKVLELLNRTISQNLKDYQEAFERDLPAWFRQGLLEWRNHFDMIKRRKQIQTEIYFLNFESVAKGQSITQEEIARALNFPFTNLIQTKRGFALCPFHKEKRPSFYVKNNWGYCFGCQWHGDTIKFLMDKDGLKFPEAVRRLS